MAVVFNNQKIDKSLRLNYPDTQFIRAFGILLIINSHLDRYYPIKELATGGAIGNSIFFFLSAFGIYLSQQKGKKPFSVWIAARLSRIYPSLWILLIIISLPLMIIAGRLNETNIMSFIGGFFDPPYAFLQMLLVYYIFSYHLLNDRQKPELISIFFLGSVVYFILYFTWVDLTKWSVEKSPFDLIHYLMIFLFGIVAARENDRISYSGLHNYFVLILLVALIYTHKFLMTKDLFTELQFLQQAAIYPIVYYLLKVSRSPFVLTKMMQTGSICSIVNFLSNHTLEIYMVHVTINYPFAKLNIPFPLNVIGFVGLTLILSALVKAIADRIRKEIE